MNSTSSAVSPTYDDDGNLTEDSKFTYKWNGDVARKCEDGQFRINCAKHEVYRVPSGRDTNQNRLIKVTPKAFEEGAVELYFVYDYQGRRVSKERRLYNPASMKFEFEKRIEYIFDGWNVILEKEYDLSNTVTDSRKRYWGLDLSGSTQGAGGVGGLLATFATKSSPATAGTETHYYHYDANGNVTETVDSNGDLTASYEYGPFGELVSEIGTYAQENTYRFSTKPQDSETGYYYYGFRYYDSVNGSWLNRDPLGEGGGFNLYAFVLNNAIRYYDLLGKKPKCSSCPDCASEQQTVNQTNTVVLLAQQLVASNQTNVVNRTTGVTTAESSVSSAKTGLSQAKSVVDRILNAIAGCLGAGTLFGNLGCLNGLYQSLASWKTAVANAQSKLDSANTALQNADAALSRATSALSGSLQAEASALTDWGNAVTALANCEAKKASCLANCCP